MYRKCNHENHSNDRSTTTIEDVSGAFSGNSATNTTSSWWRLRHVVCPLIVVSDETKYILLLLETTPRQSLESHADFEVKPYSLLVNMAYYCHTTALNAHIYILVIGKPMSNIMIVLLKTKVDSCISRNAMAHKTSRAGPFRLDGFDCIPRDSEYQSYHTQW